MSAAPEQIEAVKASLLRMLRETPAEERPYRHWLPDGVLPDDILAALQDLSFPLIDLEGVSGTREVHNSGRHYFDVDNRRRYPAVDAAAMAFQDPAVTGAIADHFDIDLDGSYLRMEYAQDGDGFWLEPHTDIGVKLFTMLLYLSDGPDHASLGMTIYASKSEAFGRTPFRPNLAMVFIPSKHTWHGFEARPIEGVRKSLIVNYVTDEWRAREQLSFPEQPVRRPH